MGRRRKVLSSCSCWSFHVGKKLRLNDSSKVKHVISGRVNIRNVCLLKLPRISDPTFSSCSTLLPPSYHSTVRGCLTPPYRRQYCQKMSHWGPHSRHLEPFSRVFPFRRRWGNALFPWSFPSRAFSFPPSCPLAFLLQ